MTIVTSHNASYFHKRPMQLLSYYFLGLLVANATPTETT